MKRSGFIKNSALLKITCADTAAVLGKIGERGLQIYDVKTVGDLTVSIRCAKEDLHRIEQLATKAGATVKVEGTYGLNNVFRRAFSRPLMLTGILILSIFILFLPTRILFIRVEGNTTIPNNRILEQAEFCGISFGVSRRQIRSEEVKNALIASMPQLQWVGINTSGCVATISVKEKSILPQASDEFGPGSIIAARDGIIRTCTVLDGTALCHEGDAVNAGQILVSGYTDCGLTLKAVRARAEITACTLRKLTAISPASSLVRDQQLHTKTKFALRIGKKLINFYKDSGISDSTCVKMYTEEHLTLPGGFRLPIALITEQCVYYSCALGNSGDEQVWLENYCEDYLIENMQAGQILTRQINTDYDGDSYIFHGEYVCLEMIGQFMNEEIISNDR